MTYKFIIILCLTSFSCQKTETFVSSLKVISIESLTEPGQGRFQRPRFGQDSLLYFTGTGERGLWKFGLKLQKLTKLNDYRGAGEQFLICRKRHSIIFRADSTDTKRRRVYQLVEQNLTTGAVTRLTGPVRNLSGPLYLDDTLLYYVENDQLRIFDLMNSRVKKDENLDFMFFTLRDRTIVRYSSEGQSKWQPIPEEPLLWLDVHPLKQLLLVYSSGHGTYVCDWQKRTTEYFGAGQAAVYSPDGRYIAYMVDQHNGLTITAADIYIAATDRDYIINVTHSPDIIEMYPCWSADGTALVFNTFEGQIKTANLIYEKGD
jgi:hypothetical protein